MQYVANIQFFLVIEREDMYIVRKIIVSISGTGRRLRSLTKPIISRCPVTRRRTGRKKVVILLVCTLYKPRDGPYDFIKPEIVIMSHLIPIVFLFHQQAQTFPLS